MQGVGGSEGIHRVSLGAGIYGADGGIGGVGGEAIDRKVPLCAANSRRLADKNQRVICCFIVSSNLRIRCSYLGFSK